MLEKEGLQGLLNVQRLRLVETLDLSYLNLREEPYQSFANILPRLLSLRLRYSLLSEHQICFLIKFLPKCPKLQCLDLDSINLSFVPSDLFGKKPALHQDQ